MGWIRENWIFVAVAGASAALLYVSIINTTQNEYVPSNKEVLFDNSTDYFNVVITKEKDILVPTTAYYKAKESEIKVAIFFKHPDISLKSIKLVSLSASSTSLLKVDTTESDPIAGDAKYYFVVKAGHPLSITNTTEHYDVKVFYRTSQDPTLPSEVKQLSIPITWNLQFLDFGQLSYFWIILFGVLASRVFTITFPESGGVSVSGADKPSLKELLWIPFSAMITLLIYSSFREQVALQGDIFANLAIAFGFGFGFDKVLDIWKRAPRKEEKPPLAAPPEQPSAKQPAPLPQMTPHEPRDEWEGREEPTIASDRPSRTDAAETA
jgi:hypothetical protein